MSSPSPTFDIWTKIFSMDNWCISFNKLQELLNSILILITYVTCFHPSFDHVSLSVILTRLTIYIHEDLTFFVKGVTLSRLRRIFYT